MTLPTYEQFQAETQALGFGEVLVREWAANQRVDIHTHPFDVNALVVRGEFVLSCGDGVRTLRAGDRFALDREVPHTEAYGPEGATFWVARRHAPA
jgi:quercetin dioxygenase-like cupin family protein